MEKTMRPILAIAAPCLLFGTYAGSSVPMTPAGNGHLVVPAFVNGKGTVPFILDTGADESSVYDWFAKQQRLASGTAISVTGMTGAAMMATYRLDSMRVDGRTIRNVAVTGLPDRKDTAITAGVAGNDLMDGAIATFDYPCRTATLTAKPVSMRTLVSPRAVKVEGGSVLEGTQLSFPVLLNGAQGTAILDTGSRGTQINGAFARSAGLDVHGAEFRPGETLYGVASRATETREGKVAMMAFAGGRIKGLTVRVADLEVFKAWGLENKPAMIFGINAMQGLRVIYDHQARRFWFDRSRCKAPV
jgi:predicted aspartyl protease